MSRFPLIFLIIDIFSHIFKILLSERVLLLQSIIQVQNHPHHPVMIKVQNGPRYGTPCISSGFDILIFYQSINNKSDNPEHPDQEYEVTLSQLRDLRAWISFLLPSVISTEVKVRANLSSSALQHRSQD